MLFALVILLMALMLAVGGERGAKSFIALCGTVLVLLACVYLIALGASPIPTTLACAALFAAVTLLYQNGARVRTHCAVLAVFAVLVLMSALVAFIGYGAKIAGYSELDRHEEISMYLSVNLAIDMRALLFAVLLFGLMGAVMDAAISIATALTEIFSNNESLTVRQLVASGGQVGRDILGTTVNTLFFAGIGETMMQSLLFFRNGYTLEALVNSKAFLQEFALMMIANLGCLIVIPIVTLLTALALKSEKPTFARMRGKYPL